MRGLITKYVEWTVTLVCVVAAFSFAWVDRRFVGALELPIGSQMSWEPTRPDSGEWVLRVGPPSLVTGDVRLIRNDGYSATSFEISDSVGAMREMTALLARDTNTLASAPSDPPPTTAPRTLSVLAPARSTQVLLYALPQGKAEARKSELSNGGLIVSDAVFMSQNRFRLSLLLAVLVGGLIGGGGMWYREDLAGFLRGAATLAGPAPEDLNDAEP